MKKMLTLIAALFILVAVNQAQTLKSLFDKYADDERFEYVSVGKGMMNMASAFGGIGKHEKEMMGKMKGIKILTLSASSDSPLMKSVERDLRQVIDDGDFETAVEARDKGERVHIYYRVSVTKEKGELSLIWMSGRMTKEEMMNSFSNTENKAHIYGNRRSEVDTIS